MGKQRKQKVQPPTPTPQQPLPPSAAQRPHILTIILTVLTVAVGAGGIYINSENTKATSKALINVSLINWLGYTSTDLPLPAAPNGEKPHIESIDVNISTINNGKAIAKDAHLHYGLYNAAPTAGQKRKLASGTMALGDLTPRTAPYENGLSIHLPSGTIDGFDQNFTILGITTTVEYMDDLLGKKVQSSTECFQHGLNRGAAGKFDACTDFMRKEVGLDKG